MRSLSYYALGTFENFKLITVRNIHIKFFKICERWGYYNGTFIPSKWKANAGSLKCGGKNKSDYQFPLVDFNILKLLPGILVIHVCIGYNPWHQFRSF